MRLLNTTNREFREFFDDEIPRYAILSHRWGSDEATFQAFGKGTQQNHEGYIKIVECCRLALEHGNMWVWIDTCCIDKRSSSELTEAINSMYDWYRKAEVCYVYLVDVVWQDDTTEAHQDSMRCFGKSSWFTRGWTLQELLAPVNVHFYDRYWQFIGNKEILVHEISEATDIDVQYLLPHTKASGGCGHRPSAKYWNPDRREPSVATRMSWVSKRKTSRIEDMAYCMLGLFHVNMPLLYGEKHRAFMRLQYEIIKQSNDDSIFAWTTNSYGTGVLANWPDKFANSKNVHERAPIRTHRRPYSITNQGLDLPITWRAWDPKTEVLRILLDCGVCGPEGLKNIVLCLKTPSGNIWNRVHSYEIETIEEGPWYNPVDPSWSISEQDPRDSHMIIARSVQRTEDPWTPADSLKAVGRKIMVQAEWLVGYGPAGPAQDIFISKL